MGEDQGKEKTTEPTAPVSSAMFARDTFELVPRCHQGTWTISSLLLEAQDPHGSPQRRKTNMGKVGRQECPAANWF